MIVINAYDVEFFHLAKFRDWYAIRGVPFSTVIVLPVTSTASLSIVAAIPAPDPADAGIPANTARSGSR